MAFDFLLSVSLFETCGVFPDQTSFSSSLNCFYVVVFRLR